MALPAARRIALSGSRRRLPFNDTDDLGPAFDGVTEQLLADTWDGAAGAAQRCLAVGQATLDAMARHRATYPETSATLSGIIMSAMLSALASRDDAAEITAAMLADADDDLAAALAASGLLDAVASGDPSGVVERLLAGRSPPSDNPLALACVAKGDLALCHAAFARTQDSSPVPGFDHEASRVLYRQALEAIADTFEDGLRQLQQSCASRDPELFRPEAMRLAHRAALELPRLGALQGRIHRAYRDNIEAGRGGEAERVGRIGCAAHLLARTLVAAEIACWRIALAEGDDSDPHDVADVIAMAGDLPFTATMPNGVNRQIPDLDGEDGAFVEVDGMVVGKSASVDEEDRLIGRVTLRDPSSGADVEAVFLFVNPTNAGIADGVHLRLSGVYRASLDLADGQSGILIDRFAFSSLVDGQWRLRMLRLAADVFPIWRNGHNAVWAMGPHRTSGRLDASRNGAAEILFLDFGLEEPEREPA